MVEAQIVRLISANEWGVTTEFWHFDFSAYLKHSTYPGFEQPWARAYFRSKRAKREVYELDPALLGPQPRILGLGRSI
jgi:hypothetical protein